MNRFDKEVKLFSRFPKHGWIFPCSQCEQPVFKEYYSRFICKQCKIKNKDYCIRISEQVKMKQNDINQLKQRVYKGKVCTKLSGLISRSFNKISPELN